MTHFLIGTDEAGYGPNLGPLVVTATLWEIPDQSEIDRLWENLKAVVCDRPLRKRKAAVDKNDAVLPLAIADSKALFKQRASIRPLELPLLSILETISGPTIGLQQLWEKLAPEFFADLQQEFWWKAEPTRWPLEATDQDIADYAGAFESCFASSGIRCRKILSAVVVPERFNDSLQTLNNKATVLTYHTLKLVANLLDEVSGSPVHIFCDRHGGRSNYVDMVQEFVTDEFVERHHESSDLSIYRWGDKETRKEIRFEIGGEKHMPVGLASMVSKYLRELAMISFNRFWQSHLPELKPTAGYPVDAKRFRNEIEPKREELGIALPVLWRER